MKYQQGSTLIMVLIVLLLITLIGTMAMRESLLNLRLSTTTQVSNVLLNSNDAALFELEDRAKVEERLVNQSVYGYFDNDSNSNDELVFCFNSKNSTFFDITRASVIGSGKLGSAGYCNKSTFSSGRDAIITQVYVRKMDLRRLQEQVGSLLVAAPASSDAGIKQISSLKYIAVSSISVLPSFANSASGDAINNCFKRTAKAEDTNNVEQCFKGLSIPYNMQYAEYSVGVDYN